MNLLTLVVEYPVKLLGWGLQILSQEFPSPSKLDAAVSGLVTAASRPTSCPIAPPQPNRQPAGPIAEPAPHTESPPPVTQQLEDDMLKLIQYSVSFVKRDLECTFGEMEVIIADNITDEVFITWKIAEFVDGLDKLPAPRNWVENSYPREYSSSDRTVQALPEEDKQFLQLHFRVLTRLPREAPQYQQRSVRALEGIGNALCRQPSTGSVIPPVSASSPEIVPSSAHSPDTQLLPGVSEPMGTPNKRIRHSKPPNPKKKA